MCYIKMGMMPYLTLDSKMYERLLLSHAEACVQLFLSTIVLTHYEIQCNDHTVHNMILAYVISQLAKIMHNSFFY